MSEAVQLVQYATGEATVYCGRPHPKFHALHARCFVPINRSAFHSPHKSSPDATNTATSSDDASSDVRVVDSDVDNDAPSSHTHFTDTEPEQGVEKSSRSTGVIIQDVLEEGLAIGSKRNLIRRRNEFRIQKSMSSLGDKGYRRQLQKTLFIKLLRTPEIKKYLERDLGSRQRLSISDTPEQDVEDASIESTGRNHNENVATGGR